MPGQPPKAVCGRRLYPFAVSIYCQLLFTSTYLVVDFRELGVVVDEFEYLVVMYEADFGWLNDEHDWQLRQHLLLLVVCFRGHFEVFLNLFWSK